MKKRRKKTKKRTLWIQEELKKFFPPADHMGATVPTRWEQVNPATSIKSPKKAVNFKPF